MIINKDSIFNLLPVNLQKTDVFYLEGIKYASNIIYLAHEELCNSLLHVSCTKNPDQNNFYSITKNVWTIVDFAWRLKLLLSQINSDKSEENSNIIDGKFFEPLKDFRDTIQHLDERIEKVIIDKNAYVWGTFGWLYHENEKTLVSCVLVPGHPRASRKIPIVNHAGLIMNANIDHITLSTVARRKGETGEITINLSELYRNIKRLIKDIESTLNKQLSEHSKNGTLDSDTLVKFVIDISK